MASLCTARHHRGEAAIETTLCRLFESVQADGPWWAIICRMNAPAAFLPEHLEPKAFFFSQAGIAQVFATTSGPMPRIAQGDAMVGRIILMEDSLWPVPD